MTIRKKSKQVETPPPTQVLRFSPTAWAKLLFLRDYGDTEVGGFGISANDDLLLIEDVRVVKQTCSWAHVAFDDESVADFFDDQIDAERRPESFARIWVHTHPGDCPQPSVTDEATFERVFGRTEWSMMFILARGGQTYARLRFHVGPGSSIKLPVELDYTRSFDGCDHAAWENEYLSSVQPELNQVQELAPIGRLPAGKDAWPDGWFDEWNEYVEDDLQLQGFARE